MAGHRNSAPRRPASLALAGCLAALLAFPAGWSWYDADRPGDTRTGSVTTPAGGGEPRTRLRISPSPVPNRVLPVSLRVPSLDVDAVVRPTGVADDGTMELPELGSEVGWYRFGPVPGAPSGSAVLAGHVDTRADGPGALHPLRNAVAGRRIEVGMADGRSLTYIVVSRVYYPRDALPGKELFARTGSHRLTVITCGGRYVRGRGYSHNVVVSAVPA